MNEDLRRFTAACDAAEVAPCESKLASLADAIRKHVTSGMSIFVAYEAGAAIRELVRCFHGRQPSFELITTLLYDTTTIPLHAGLARKVLFANSGYFYPSTAPNRIVQRLFRERSDALENWTHYTLQLRLMAGAMGVPFMVTKSLAGTSMAEENRESFRLVDNPFGIGKTGIVRSLNPDIAIMHAVAADQFGNAITIPLAEDTLWAARAARLGVVLTVEKVVSHEVIRANPHLVNLPGYMVRSVSPAPFGAHPQGIVHQKLAGFESYGADNDFRQEYFTASQEASAMDAWLTTWVLDTRSNEGYLDRLGGQRLQRLRRLGTEDGWRSEVESALANLPAPTQSTAYDMMLVAAARKIEENSLKEGHNLLLVGIGMPALAGWPAYCRLRQRGHQIECLVGNGQFGYLPSPADPNFINMRIKSTCKIWSDVVETYGSIISSPRASCLSVLGAGQVDARGNINSSYIGKTYIAGSGGANDNTSLAREIMVVAPQSRRRFVSRLPFVTCTGERVRTVVSTMGVFEKRAGADEFWLTQYFPGPQAMTADQALARIREECEWDLRVAEDLGAAEPPTTEELLSLNAFDPKRLYLGA